jgi:PAS domain S-box-containing protein
VTTFCGALDALCLLVDEQASGLRSGVLVLDETGRRWQVVATPGLPDSRSRYARWMEVTPTSGASGAAVHERKQVVVTDFEASHLYPTISVDAAQAAGLRSCWATPFFSRRGRVLGVVTIYCPESREPTDRERLVMARIAHLAGIVTEGMLAQQALDASEARFRLATEVLAGFLFDWDLATNRLRWFGGLEEVLGFGLDEVSPDIVWYESRVHPDDLGDARKSAQAAIESGASGYSNVYRFLHRDGHWVDVADHGRIVRDETGRPIRVLGGVSDISECRRLERVREALLQREHEARVAAENAARQRDHVLNVVAHELGSPLRTIGVCAEVLAQFAASFSECDGAVDLIDRCVKSMQQQIHDLTDVAIIESGRLALNARCESASDLVSTAVEMFATTADVAGVDLETCVAPALPAVRADAVRVNQVLGNLLTNALRHTPRGGRVALRAELDAAAVRFTVLDTGSGIAAEELSHLFDRFWEGRRAAQRGGGLGLPIVRGIVEAHGGAVDVCSTVGEGSRFSFTIPAIPIED